jgi:hypothetical protein
MPAMDRIERIGRSAAGANQEKGRGEHHMNKSTILAVALAFLSVWVVMVAGLTAVWLTKEVRVIGLIALPTAIVASLLVLYFDWRARLQRRIVAKRKARHELDKAA